jgi:hypothetical protein
MTFALIEVEATAKKAARGAGYSWGMAEEAAKATRWLCAAGIDGVGVLAQVLTRVDGSELGTMAPGALHGDWRAEAGEMCPLMAGAALSDSAVDWAEDGKRIEMVVAPALLLPFAALAARQLGTAVTVEWNGARAVTDGSAASLAVDKDSVLLETAGQVSIRSGGRLDHPLPQQHRASPAETDWAILAKLAHRTYAPDTEESRLKGAGAGLTDND